jgi:hypothetical protein
MRQPEVSEMEFRESYVNQATQFIPEWAEEHAASTYGGYYINDKEGGKIYVGFTANQAAEVEALRQVPGLIAPGQIYPMPQPPANPLLSLEATEASVAAVLEGNSGALNATTSISVSPESDVIEVEATNPGLVREVLAAHFGSNAPITTVAAQQIPRLTSYSRFHISGPVAGGDDLEGSEGPEPPECTASFGARAKTGESRGAPVYSYFVMTAGHCFPKYSSVFRRAERGHGSAQSGVGTVRRYAYGEPDGQIHTDSEAISVPEERATDKVYVGNPNAELRMVGVERARVGRVYCWSGVYGGLECGKAFRRKLVYRDHRLVYEVLVNGPTMTGDSGSPVWNPATNRAVGQIVTNFPGEQRPCVEKSPHFEECPLTGFQPLLPFAGKTVPVGSLPIMGLELSNGTG